MDTFDLVVLGGGPGGYVAAIRAAQLGLKTAIIEKDRLGGVCLNWGCIPTKALLKNAEILHWVKNAGKYGIDIPDYAVDFPKTIKRSRQVAERLSKGVEFLMKKNRITHIVGSGSLVSATELEIIDKGKKTSLEANKIILATGGRPKTFPGMDIDGIRILYSKEAMVLEQPPEKIVIIGAGAIGVEFGYFFHEYGSEVHLVEMLPRILPLEDKDISQELEKHFIKAGIRIHTDTRVNKIKSLKTKVKVETVSGGVETMLEGDVALVAVGVTGNIEGLGLEKLGIETDAGAIAINDYCQTNLPGIYAVGDVTGPPWLAHVASAQGHVAAEHAAGKETSPVDYSTVPACVYCQPQVASLGLTEEEAQREGHEIRVGTFQYRANGKAIASGETTGFAKLIFDARYGEILGCHILGAEATEMIAELAVAKALESTWMEIAHTIHAHPTLSEILMEAALDAYGEAIHH